MKAVVDRIVQYANRYRLTNVETGEVLGTFDFDEVTGTVEQVGTEINAELFDSIAADLAARVVSAGGELAGTIVTFSDISGTAENVASGDTSATLWGKVKNWFSRLKALAFKDKISNTDVAENAAIAQSKVNGLESALAGKQPTITGAATSITNNNLTASRVVVSDESGKIDVSAVTATELNYISGADRNIQNQIEDIKDGTTPPVQATRAQQDGDGANIVQTYAKKNGSYSELTAGKATEAATAGKVSHGLTITIDGVPTVYDGSGAKSVTINTSFSTDAEAVHFTEQALTSEQQTQARENIGAAGTSGSYPNMTVGNATHADSADSAAKATQDGNGDNIAATYAKQNGNYPNLTAGNAVRLARTAIAIGNNTENTIGWWKIGEVTAASLTEYSSFGGDYSIIFLINGISPMGSNTNFGKSGIIELDGRVENGAFLIAAQNQLKILGGNIEEGDISAVWSAEKIELYCNLKSGYSKQSFTVLSEIIHSTVVNCFAFAPSFVSASIPSGASIGVNQNRAAYDAAGNDISETYAKQIGTYPSMTVGNAGRAKYDADGNDISDTYAKQSGTYTGMTVGKANKAISDGGGNQISTTYLKVSDLLGYQQISQPTQVDTILRFSSVMFAFAQNGATFKINNHSAQFAIMFQIPTAGTIFIFYINNGAIAIDGNANSLQCELDPNGSNLFYMTINPR